MTPSNPGKQGGGRYRSEPRPALRPFVVEYWGFARDLTGIGGFTITPDRFGELICCVDDLVCVGGSGREKLPTCFLVGLLEGPIRIEATGVVRCMAARLQPWSVGMMSGEGAERPARGWKDATDLFGPLVAEASDLVGRCEWEAAARIFDRVLSSEVGRRKPDVACIDATEEFLDDAPRPTASVARAHRVTRRQVERRVRKATHTSPKRLACLARFQKVRDAIWADPAIDLARLAIDAGYADQPHMTRHFRRYAGETPGQFIVSSLARKKWLAGQDVAFVQDRAGGGD